MALIQVDVKSSTSYNKTVDTYYVYEVTYFLNTETGKKTKKRRVIGKVDPETKEVVATRSYRGSKATQSTVQNNTSSDLQTLYDSVVKESNQQIEFDRNAKIQLTAALVRSSECLESIISKASHELASIKEVLTRFGLKT